MRATNKKILLRCWADSTTNKDEKHLVIFYTDGTAQCECLGEYFKGKNHPTKCKHIRKIEKTIKKLAK